MGLLDDAIREHLELKRRHGAEPGEIAKLEHEAFGPVRRGETAEAPPPVHHEAPPSGDELDYELGEEEVPAPPHAGEAAIAEDEWELDEDEAPAAYEPAPHEPVPHEAPAVHEPPPAAPEPPAGQETVAFSLDELDEEEPAAHEPPPAPPPPGAPVAEPEAPIAPPAGARPAHDDEPEVVPADEEPGEEDVLEETPDFLQETPEHDRLWFEQKPPRDFDF